VVVDEAVEAQAAVGSVAVGPEAEVMVVAAEADSEL